MAAIQVFVLLSVMLFPSFAIGSSTDRSISLRASAVLMREELAIEEKTAEGAKKAEGDNKTATEFPKKTGLNDPMPMKANEQGFSGKKVEHVNGETVTSDWQKEFGPNGPTDTTTTTTTTPKKASAAIHLRANVLQGATKEESGNKTASEFPKKTGLNDPMTLKAKEQGFSGKKVEHVSGETVTSDWGKEFGPNGPTDTTTTTQPKKASAALHLRANVLRREEPAKEEKKDAGAKKEGGNKTASEFPKNTGLDDPMPLKAQEQGYSGKQVEHVDGETVTSDWQKEFGPHGPTDTTTTTTTKPKKSSAPRAIVSAVAFVGVLLGARL